MEENFVYPFNPKPIKKIKKIGIVAEDQYGNNVILVTPSDVHFYNSWIEERYPGDVRMVADLFKGLSGIVLKSNTYIDKMEISEEDFLSILEDNQ